VTLVTTLSYIFWVTSDKIVFFFWGVAPAPSLGENMDTIALKDDAKVYIKRFNLAACPQPVQVSRLCYWVQGWYGCVCVLCLGVWVQGCSLKGAQR